MYLLQEFGPLLAAMTVLAVGSAFFSCSEAALFSLQPDDRRKLKLGTAAERKAVELLDRAELLLMAILFWNLITNVVYFAIASIIGIKLQAADRQGEAGAFALAALLAIIICSEMLPKTIGVLAPRQMTRLLGVPIRGAVELFRPLAPAFRAVNQGLRRLFFPGFVVEPYLALNDLEQAITVSTSDEELAAQERTALQNIVMLSDMRADELMRPRTQYRTFTLPVHLNDLGGQPTRSGYLLVAEPEHDEIVSAVALANLPTLPRQNLELYAQPLVFMPWCASVSAVFEQLRTQALEVAAIVNEHGETVGIVTLDDLLQTVFEDQPSRSSRLLATSPIHPLGDNRWRVTGMTSLRRLARHFQLQLPKSRSTTVAGIVQEQLQRLPEPGDLVRWNVFQFRVLQADPQGPTTVELEIVSPDAEQS